MPDKDDPRKTGIASTIQFFSAHLCVLGDFCGKRAEKESPQRRGERRVHAEVKNKVYLFDIEFAVLLAYALAQIDQLLSQSEN